MSYYFPEPDNNEILRRFGGPMLPATLGESMGAAFDDPTLRPTEMIGTQMDIEAARDRPSIATRLAETRARREGALGRPLSIRDAERIARTRQEPALPEDEDLVAEPEERLRTDLDRITAEEANERFGHTGAKFDAPVNPRVAELVAEQKQEEKIRQDIIARGPQGVLPTAARFGASFAGAAIDPLNIASAFIPIVGEARFAGMVARIGVTQARFARGAIEGVVGNALIEPLVYGLAREQQLDYEMSDALANIAFGGLLGGGLHVGVGRVGDYLAARSPEAREAALRSAVAQTIRGERVDIDPVYRSDFDFLRPDRALVEDIPLRAEPPPAREFELGEPTGVGRGQVYRSYTPPGPQDRTFLEGLVEELMQTDRGHRLFIEAEGQGGTPDVIGVPASTPRWFQDHNAAVSQERKRIKQVRQVNEKLPDAQKMSVPKTPEILTRARVEAVVGKMVEGKPLGVAEADVARLLFDVARGQRQENVRQMLDFRRDREFDSIAEREARDVARDQGLPERDITADFPASERASRMLDERQDDSLARVEAENEFLGEQFEAMRAAGLITEREAQELQLFNDMGKNAEGYGKAAMAAAHCLSRRS